MGLRDFRRGLREVEIKWMRPPRHTYRHQTPLATQTQTHTLPHTLCIHATVLCSSLWSELLGDTKEKNPEWCVSSMKALNEIFTAAEKWMKMMPLNGSDVWGRKKKRSYLPSWSRIHGHWAAACRRHWKLFIHLGHNVKEFKPVRPQNLECVRLT